MIEQWIDAVCKVWEIDDGRGGTVYSYRVFEKNEFPESIRTFPAAITYPVSVRPIIAAGGGYNLWTGQTEFHIASGTKKSDIPYIIRFFPRIRTAMAANVKLGGLVAYFMPVDADGAFQGPVVMNYGSETPSQGIIVRWTVKETISETVSA